MTYPKLGEDKESGMRRVGHYYNTPGNAQAVRQYRTTRADGNVSRQLLFQNYQKKNAEKNSRGPAARDEQECLRERFRTPHGRRRVTVPL